jgi:hypothetical protein
LRRQRGFDLFDPAVFHRVENELANLLHLALADREEPARALGVKLFAGEFAQRLDLLDARIERPPRKRAAVAGRPRLLAVIPLRRFS